MLKRTFIIMLSLALFFTTSPAAARAETFNYKFMGLMADAYFSITDETGCIETASYLTAFDGKINYDKQSETDSFIYVVVFQYDHCVRNFLLDAWGDEPLLREDFTINNQLDLASLDTKVIVKDAISGNEFPVDIQLTWIATGEGFSDKEHRHTKEPGHKVNYRYIASVRPAMSDGSITGLGLNFAQMPSGSAQLSNVKAGFVEITLTHK